MKKKVLLIRLDKIGDLISTMCVDQILDPNKFESEWVIAKGLGFVGDYSQPKRSFVEFEKNKKSLNSFLAFLQETKPDIAVSFQAPWWVNYALWKAGIPVRAGVQSQWHSYLFLNKGLRQKRSQAKQHEADYNRDLLNFAVGQTKSDAPTPSLLMKAPANSRLLEEHKLQAKEYIVVHPGMAGSALNWPTDYYISYIEEAKKHEQVILTGTLADEPWLSEIKKHFAKDPQVLCLQNKLKATELLTILENAKWVVAPSTGVAHIAASLKTPVIGIYSPIQVQHPRRWAARGENVFILKPDIDCPAQFHCLKEKCKHYDCMRQITPERLLKL